ncbi:MAG: serine acetyltransferase [Clostridia bacterium]|nr:serine acetyltransferase [Clostridia bacterium]MBQ6614280.1 serine acetyltransferase [Clostridia bacterium]
MNNSFKKDLYRYYGEGGEPLLKKIFRPLELKYISAYRKANECRFLPLKLFYMLHLMHLSNKTQIQIPARTRIGEGFYIGHFGRLIIHPDAVIGKNVNVGTGVTIGMEVRGKRKGTPTISDDCWIGTNAVIVGNVKIGTDVLIAPLSFVNFDVPDHSIVVGNPARIISKENATEGYVHNRI